MFSVPDDLSKVFERDRVVAGIAKSDDCGRVVDVTLATFRSDADVANSLGGNVLGSERKTLAANE